MVGSVILGCKRIKISKRPTLDKPHKSHLLHWRKPLGLPVHCLKRLHVHVHYAWHHLVQAADVVRADIAFGANLVDKTGDRFDDIVANFTWILLLLKARLCIHTVALDHTVGDAVAGTVIIIVVAPLTTVVVRVVALGTNVQRHQQVHHSVGVMDGLAVQSRLLTPN